jgi:hypothetical protein
MTKPALYRFSQFNNEILCCLASPGILSDTKFVFTNEYEIKIPNTLFVENKNNSYRKMCENYRDFNNSTFIKFRKLDLEISVNFFIPYFKSTEFICLSCNKIHNGKTEKCCSMTNNPIKIKKVELYKVLIPEKSAISDSIMRARTEFVDLHFPDIMSTMLLR